MLNSALLKIDHNKFHNSLAGHLAWAHTEAFALAACARNVLLHVYHGLFWYAHV